MLDSSGCVDLATARFYEHLLPAVLVGAVKFALCARAEKFGQSLPRIPRVTTDVCIMRGLAHTVHSERPRAALE